MQATEIYFSKKCEFWFSNANAAVPLGDCIVSDLAEFMNEKCGNSVVIQFRSSDQHMKSDIAKNQKRIDSVAGWTFSEWQSPVIKGHTLTVIKECVATRSAGTPSVESVRIRSRIANMQADLSRMENSSGNGQDLVKMIRLRDEIMELQYKVGDLQFV